MFFLNLIQNNGEQSGFFHFVPGEKSSRFVDLLNAAKDGKGNDQAQNQSAAAALIKTNLAKAKESEDLEAAMIRKLNAHIKPNVSIQEAFAEFQ